MPACNVKFQFIVLLSNNRCHCEERSDVAISRSKRLGIKREIATAAFAASR